MMKTYDTLLNKLNDKYWEDLTTTEKEMLVNAHIMTKPTLISHDVTFQKSLLNLLNVDIDKISPTDLLKEFVSIRISVFQAIKEDIEKDLEKAWEEDTEENETFEKDHKKFRYELLKDHPDLLELINGGLLFKHSNIIYKDSL